MLGETTKIVDKINQCLELDGGNRFRQYLREEMSKDSDAYRQEVPNTFRSHLGASLIGRECDRELWLHFRFCAAKNLHPGRMIRLFNRGHLEEARFIALLRQAGCQVWNESEDGKQFRFSAHGGHFGGSIDGVVRGIPEFPGEPMLLECKTHNDRSFTQLQKAGMQSVKPEHYVQMQLYMNAFNLSRGLYIAVDKNDDSLYAEIVALNKSLAQGYLDRAGKIIFAQDVPARVPGATSCGWHTCKWCDFAKFCWSRAAYTPHTQTCRTCIHGRATLDGWQCDARGMQILTRDEQVHGCETYSVLASVQHMGL